MPATMAQTVLKKATGGALGDYPNFGMSMRFLVVVDDVQIKNLGLWQSCKGLSVELKYKKVGAGGLYTQEYLLPESLSYGKVKLERAVNENDSTAVQQWLTGYVSDWNSYPASRGAAPQSTNVVITLLDYQLDKVMAWTLRQARPTKWDGPSLSATENKVAIESLEFEHEGFLSVSGGH
ncbi:MAG TPA: phage tail protein [Streptosporangiaceae bacterium]|nr:phage tail protein [Streptosporangiaceae bacterium]